MLFGSKPNIMASPPLCPNTGSRVSVLLGPFLELSLLQLQSNKECGL